MTERIAQLETTLRELVAHDLQANTLAGLPDSPELEAAVRLVEELNEEDPEWGDEDGW